MFLILIIEPKLGKRTRKLRVNKFVDMEATESDDDENAAKNNSEILKCKHKKAIDFRSCI